MLTQSTAQEIAWSSGERRWAVRVEIADSGGTLRDWSSLDGVDHIASVEWGESVDALGRDASVRLYHRHYLDNGSPWVSSSRLASYLNVGRRIRIEVALYPEGQRTDDWVWLEVFDGEIDTLDIASYPATLTARDRRVAEYQDRWIESETEYGTEAGRDIEDVITDILGDWVSTHTSLTVATSPGFAITPYNQQPMNVAQALDDLVALIGWDLRPKWTGTVWRLSLHEPERTSPTSDATFSPDDYLTVSRAAISLADVRNVIRVHYVSGTTTGGDYEISSVTRSDATSISEYGRRWMELTEGSSSSIDTGGEANALGDAILADLKDPDLNFGVELPLFPWVEINDYYTFEADGERFGADQSLAVQSYRCQLSPGLARTTLEVSGQPKSGRRNWIEREARPGQGATRGTLAPRVVGGVSKLVSVGAAKITWDRPESGDYDIVEIHRSNTSGFTPGASTLVQAVRGTSFTDTALDPAKTYYYQVITRDEQGNGSAASSEVSAKPTWSLREDSMSLQRSNASDLNPSSSPYSFETDTTDWGDATHFNDPNIEPGAAGIYAVQVRLEPGDAQDTATWRAKVIDANSSTTLIDSGDITGDDPIELSRMVRCTSSSQLYVEVSWPGTACEIAADSYFAVVTQLPDKRTITDS